MSMSAACRAAWSSLRCSLSRGPLFPVAYDPLLIQLAQAGPGFERVVPEGVTLMLVHGGLLAHRCGYVGLVAVRVFSSHWYWA
jgi:hypothetical protein